MQWMMKQQGMLFGLLLGVLAIGAIVWTNVLSPNFESDSEYETTYAIGYLILILFFVFVGFLASRQTRRLLSGAWAGALAALLGKGTANLWPAAITRLTAEWRGDYAAWVKRDLSARRYVYVWPDGSPCRRGWQPMPNACSW